jgi:hypothetical protein
MNDFQRSDYGPNYPDAKTEAKALRQQVRESWYDITCMVFVILVLLGGAYGFHVHFLTTD